MRLTLSPVNVIYVFIANVVLCNLQCKLKYANKQLGAADCVTILQR